MLKRYSMPATNWVALKSTLPDFRILQAKFSCHTVLPNTSWQLFPISFETAWYSSFCLHERLRFRGFTFSAFFICLLLSGLSVILYDLLALPTHSPLVFERSQ